MTARDDAAAWLDTISDARAMGYESARNTEAEVQLRALLAEHDALLARVAACEVQVVERGEDCAIGYGAIYVNHNMVNKRVRLLPEPPK